LASVSVIIPALDEARALPVLLPALAAAGAQVIVVDGGSTDGTVAAVSAVAGVRLVQAAPPRAAQMNAGAACATGDALLFLHADARPPGGFMDDIVAALSDPAVVGGAFALAIDDPRPAARLVAWGANLRTRLTGHPYGDQGIFVRRPIFAALGGYAALPFMEDLEFSARLRRRGRLRLLRTPVVVSARRWRAQGYARTTFRNTVIAACYYLGIDPSPLAHWVAPQREEGATKIR
jgi:rSAM/selenodomain-associated transferase 2